MLRGAAAVQTFYDSERAYVTELCERATTFSVATGIDLPVPQWSGNGDYLAWFGRYSPHHKGIDRMLAAYARIPMDARIPLRLRGVDYQGGRLVVERMVESMGLESYVSVGDPVLGQDKVRFLGQSAGFIFPSRWESQGIALLEALGLGVPSVVSDSIHLAKNLNENSAALISDFSNPDASANSMIEVINNAEFGRNARRYVGVELAWDHQFDALMQNISRYVE